MTSKTDYFDILGLRRSLKNTPSETSSLLLKTMLDSFKDRVCINQCQFNRVVCILRPKCPHRQFQDLLLQSGYPFKEIPQFCYSIRLKEINENFNREIPFTADVNLYLSDFHRIFGLKKSRFHPKREFSKICQYYSIENYSEVTKTFLILGLKKNIVFVDLDLELVTLNPNSWILDDISLVKSVIQVLAREYEVEIEIQEEHDVFLELTFKFSHSSEFIESIESNKLEQLIRHSDNLMGYEIGSENIEIYGEIQIADHEISPDNLKLISLRRVFEEINEFQPQDLMTTVKSSKEETKKSSNV